MKIIFYFFIFDIRFSFLPILKILGKSEIPLIYILMGKSEKKKIRYSWIFLLRCVYYVVYKLTF